MSTQHSHHVVNVMICTNTSLTNLIDEIASVQADAVTMGVGAAGVAVAPGAVGAED